MHALLFSVPWLHEKLEDTKEVIRIRKSKNRKHNGQKMTNNIYKKLHRKLTMGQRDKKLHRKLTMGQREPHQKPGANSRAPLVVLVAPVTNPIKSHEWENGRELLTTSGTYLGSFYRKVSSLPTPDCQF